MTLTPKEVRAMVNSVRAMAGDAEVAHGQEDALHHRVLIAIRDNTCTDPRACAREALETQKIDFPRWCA